MLPYLCQVVCETIGKKKTTTNQQQQQQRQQQQKPEFPLFSVSPPFPAHPFFCSSVLFHYCCCLWLCLAWLLQMTALYSPLFLPCFLFCFMLQCFYLDMHPTVSQLIARRITLFPIPASPLSSAVLSESMRLSVLCVTAVHPSCFFPS